MPQSLTPPGHKKIPKKLGVPQAFSKAIPESVRAHFCQTHFCQTWFQKHTRPSLPCGCLGHLHLFCPSSRYTGNPNLRCAQAPYSRKSACVRERQYPSRATLPTLIIFSEQRINMPFETLLSKVIKRRKPEREKSDGKGIDGKGERRRGAAERLPLSARTIKDTVLSDAQQMFAHAPPKQTSSKLNRARPTQSYLISSSRHPDRRQEEGGILVGRGGGGIADGLGHGPRPALRTLGLVGVHWLYMNSSQTHCFHPISPLFQIIFLCKFVSSGR